MRVHAIGAQRVTRRSPAERPIRAVIWLGALLLVAELVRANLSLEQQRDWPWKLRLLGIPTTAAILAAALIALLLRDQYARSVAPMLRYVSQWVSDTDVLTSKAGRYRQVIVRNAGPGTAVIVGTAWRVGTAPGSHVVDVGSMVALRDLLADAGLGDGADYTITNYSAGSALAPGEERLYFECADTALSRFGVLEVVFEFESLLGDRYDKAISLLPHPGASVAVAPPSALLGA